MPVLRVVSRMGKPLVPPLQAWFGPAGGMLGRSPDCTLCLPDEGRHLSRRQARVDVTHRGASITCLSASNSLVVNGQELCQGQSRSLAHGDRIHVAGFELLFEEEAAAVEQRRQSTGAGIPDDPFVLPDMAPAAGASADPFAGSFAEDPFAEPLAVPPGAPSTAGSMALTPRGAPIPEEFDPFSMSPASRPAAAQGGTGPCASDPLGLGLQADPMAELAASRAESIDALFGLVQGEGDPLGPDSPLGRPAGEPAAAGSKAGEMRDPEPMADDASVLAGSFRLPQAIPPTEFGVPDDAVLSWKGESAVARSALLPPAPHPAGTAALDDDLLEAQHAASRPSRRGSSPPSVDDGERSQDPVAGRFPAKVPGHELGTPAVGCETAAGSAEPREGGNEAEFLRALLRGLGLAELPRRTGEQTHPAASRLTPEFMRRIGELLAVASNGTVELLQARATLKQEMRAEVTMIGARDNNPLKFAPDGKSALNHLLSPHPVRGFMDAPVAMRDAYDDLLAHQIGFVAGMRAAMQGLIARFDPAVLEGRLASKSVLESMLPAARKARLWELFQSLYGEVSREAEDDFERLFGREFSRAYEEQIARIEAAAPQAGKALSQRDSSVDRRG